MNLNYNSKSDYAINKKSEDIVYLFANGEEVRYRKENGRIYKVVNSVDVSEVPDWEMSAEDFDRIKAISNEDYHETEKHDKRITRNNVSIDKLIETACISDRSAEDEYFDYLDELEAEQDMRTMDNAMSILDECLNEKQKRWFLLSNFNGFSAREIARKEDISHTTVSRGLAVIDKKIKKYFANA